MGGCGRQEVAALTGRLLWPNAEHPTLTRQPQPTGLWITDNHKTENQVPQKTEEKDTLFFFFLFLFLFLFLLGGFEAGPAAVLLNAVIPDAHHHPGWVLDSSIAPIAPIASDDRPGRRR